MKEADIARFCAIVNSLIGVVDLSFQALNKLGGIGCAFSINLDPISNSFPFRFGVIYPGPVDDIVNIPAGMKLIVVFATVDLLPAVSLATASIVFVPFSSVIFADQFVVHLHFAKLCCLCNMKLSQQLCCRLLFLLFLNLN